MQQPRVILGTWWPRRMVWRDDAVRLDASDFTVARSGLIVSLSPTQWRIVAAVLAGGVWWVARSELRDVLWGDRADGGPDCPDSNLGRQMHVARRRLAPLGVFFLGRHGWGWRGVVEASVPERRAA